MVLMGSTSVCPPSSVRAASNASSRSRWTKPNRRCSTNPSMRSKVWSKPARPSTAVSPEPNHTKTTKGHPKRCPFSWAGQPKFRQQHTLLLPKPAVHRIRLAQQFADPIQRRQPAEMQPRIGIRRIAQLPGHRADQNIASPAPRLTPCTKSLHRLWRLIHRRHNHPSWLPSCHGPVANHPNESFQTGIDDTDIANARIL